MLKEKLVFAQNVNLSDQTDVTCIFFIIIKVTTVQVRPTTNGYLW